MDPLTEHVKEFVRSWGGVFVGIATCQTLEGGPPSVDLGYVLPEAESAISFAVPLDRKLIRSYLAKEDRLSQEQDNLQANMRVTGIAAHLARHLEQMGHRSKGLVANESYREDGSRGKTRMYPDLSHRYIAIRSGVGCFGLSGNVITPGYGAAVILGTCVTAAELEPTDPLRSDANYCDGCKICMASCCSGLMDSEIETKVILGGQEFLYAKRRNYLRCEFVCTGITGLHPSKKWSTWSPGRFSIPEDDQALREAMVKGLKTYLRRPPMEGGYPHLLMRSKLYRTCGNCQLVCWPDREDRKENLRILTSSGVVIQSFDGSLKRVSPEEAEAYVKGLDMERQSLYF